MSNSIYEEVYSHEFSPVLQVGSRLDSKIRVSLCFSCGYPSVSAVRVIHALAKSIIGFQNMFTAQKPAHLLLPLQSDRCSKPPEDYARGEKIHVGKTNSKI